ncbi:MAG: DUF4870 domain-containing protein [bacterium]|nr:DUF4870 domain-containing protein [bacterium]
MKPESSSENTSQSAPGKWLVGLQLSQFALFITIFPLGNVIAPLVIWRLKRDAVPGMDEAGREIINFQLSIALYLLISIALCRWGIGYLLLVATLVFDAVMIVQATLAAERGKLKQFPLAIQFFR